MAVAPRQLATLEGFRLWGERQRCLRPRTVTQYCQRVAAADNWMVRERDKPLESAMPSDLRKYFFETKATAHNRNNIRTALIAYWDYLIDLGARKTNLAQSLLRQKEPSHLPRPFSETERALLMQAATAYSPFFECITVVLFHTGLRISEVLELRRYQIETCRTTLRQKGGGERPVYFNRVCMEAFDAWNVHRPTSPWVFPSPRDPSKHVGRDWIERKFADFGRQMRIENCNPHRCRHYCVSEIVRITGRITVAQRVAGHKSIKTTQRYTLIGDEELEGALDRLGERK